MTNVLALDISKSSCGVAAGDGSTAPRTSRHSFSSAISDGQTFAAFQRWLSDLIKVERPSLIAAEAALLFANKKGSAEAARMLLGMSAIAKCTAALRQVAYYDVAVPTWRKAFLGIAKPSDPKQAAMNQCDLLGGEYGGTHDRAEAAGIWVWAHVTFGNRRAVIQQLSTGSVRRMADARRDLPRRAGPN